MDVDGGKAASENLGNLESDVVVVDRAGHNVHLDNPDGFNRIVQKILRED